MTEEEKGSDPSLDGSEGGLDDTDDEALPGGGAVAPMDFSLFVLSLNTSALMHLGKSMALGEPALVNLPLARQVIDILAMLEEKTHGNLTGKEEQLLNQVLFDLRMRFTQLAPGKAPSPSR